MFFFNVMVDWAWGCRRMYACVVHGGEEAGKEQEGGEAGARSDGNLGGRRQFFIIRLQTPAVQVRTCPEHMLPVSNEAVQSHLMHALAGPSPWPDGRRRNGVALYTCTWIFNYHLGLTR